MKLNEKKVDMEQIERLSHGEKLLLYFIYADKDPAYWDLYFKNSRGYNPYERNIKETK